MTDLIDDRYIGIVFIKYPDPKIVLPHHCQIMRLMNEIIPLCPPCQIMVSVHVLHPINSPKLCIEHRTLTSHFSALANGLFRLTKESIVIKVHTSNLVTIQIRIYTIWVCKYELE